MTHYTLWRNDYKFATGVYNSITEAQSAAIQIFAGICMVRDQGLGFTGWRGGEYKFPDVTDISIVPAFAKYRYRGWIVATKEYTQWFDLQGQAYKALWDTLVSQGADIVPGDDPETRIAFRGWRMGEKIAGAVNQDLVGYFTADGHKVE